MRTPAILTTAILAVTISWSQEISIKTVPLETGSQFLLFASDADRIGGVSISRHDSLADPFTNPAAGVLLPGVRLMAMPSYYSFSMNSGGASGLGRTFPFSLQFHSGNYFGGILFARQSIVPGGSVPGAAPAAGSSENEHDNRTNSYAQGTFGLRIPESDISLGGSISWVDLRAVEGVQLLYAGASKLQQEGSMADYRLGMLWDFASDGSWEVVVSHHRRDLWQSVSAPPVFLYEISTDSRRPGQVQSESNHDQMFGYGIMTKYRRPVSETWNFGVELVANRKSFPKIPNYELMNIPRDPGNALAFNIGAGLSTRGRTVFGFDLLYEPIISNTWADTPSPLSTSSGRVLPSAAHTIDNRFVFSNVHIRTGIVTSGNRVNLSLGMNLHHIHYVLTQQDHVTETERRATEGWSEVTLNLGLEIPFPWGRIRYLGLVTMGAGQPGVVPRITDVRVATDAAHTAADFMIAPSGDLSLNEALVGTHQLSLIIDLP